MMAREHGEKISKPHPNPPEGEPAQALERRSMSWLAMLAWIIAGFTLAGLVAYRLVTPFFHHG